MKKFMARRRTRTKRRRSRSISALNLLESYTYASILSKGLAGYSNPIAMLRGADDLQMGTENYLESYGFGQTRLAQRSVVEGADQISLADIISSPGLATSALQSNFMNNYQAMAFSAFGTRLAFKFGKKLLRQPISNVNRNIMKPLGVGIKL